MPAGALGLNDRMSVTAQYGRSLLGRAEERLPRHSEMGFRATDPRTPDPRTPDPRTPNPRTLSPGAGPRTSDPSPRRPARRPPTQAPGPSRHTKGSSRRELAPLPEAAGAKTRGPLDVDGSRWSVLLGHLQLPERSRPECRLRRLIASPRRTGVIGDSPMAPTAYSRQLGACLRELKRYRPSAHSAGISGGSLS